MAFYFSVSTFWWQKPSTSLKQQASFLFFTGASCGEVGLRVAALITAVRTAISHQNSRYDTARYGQVEATAYESNRWRDDEAEREEDDGDGGYHTY